MKTQKQCFQLFNYVYYKNFMRKKNQNNMKLNEKVLYTQKNNLYINHDFL